MAEFVRAQIFGTTFEITSRYVAGKGTSGEHAMANSTVGMPIFSLLGWELSALSGRCLMNARISANLLTVSPVQQKTSLLDKLSRLKKS